MLCQCCKDFDLDQLISDEGFLHHKNMEDLERAARSGCELCELLRSSRSYTGSGWWPSIHQPPNTNELANGQINRDPTVKHVPL